MAQIAVIVPVYNSSAYLAACVDSILGQTYKDYEVILVDDGSTDNSGGICDEYAAQYGKVKVVHQRNGGLISAWTRGVRESSAPYLFFVDSDDWIEANALEVLSQGLLLSSSDIAPDLAGKAQQSQTSADDIRQIVCAGCVIEREWNHTSSPEDNALAPGVYEGAALQEVKDHLLGNEYRQILPSRCMKLIDRRLVEDNIHYCDPAIKMGEDMSITTPAILDADRVVILDQAHLYHYRFVAESMVHGYDAGMYRNMQNLTAILRKVYQDRKIANGEAQVNREFVYLFLIALKNEIRRNASTDEVVTGVQRMCEDAGSAALLESIGGREVLTGSANRLLGWVMENPRPFRIRTARTAFRLKR